jgi:hypothetical protein
MKFIREYNNFEPDFKIISEYRYEVKIGKLLDKAIKNWIYDNSN